MTTPPRNDGDNGNGHGGSGARSTGDVVSMARFRAGLARSPAAARVDALLSARDPAAAVAALSVPELFGLIKEVGLADTAELVALATPEQLRGCFDLDIWDRDRLVDEAIRPWLTTLLDAGGYEKLGQVWEALDPELTALLLARWTRIYDHTLDEAPPDDTERPLYRTPDTFFTVEILAEDDADVRLVLRLIDDLYRADMALARHTLMAARSELPAELEEMSYRWRSGRMADLGYVDFYDALEVFRPLEPTSIRLDEGTADVIPPPAEGDEALVPRRLPAPLADALDGAPFLARAVDALADPADLERLEAAMVVLVNKVLSASRVSPGDLDAAIAGARCAAATVSLGLETVAGGDVDRAARALAQVSLTRLHRAGFTVTLRLARLARALAPRAAAADDDDRALLGALLAARPWLPDGDGGLRPIASVADVRAAAGALARLALRIAIAEQALGVDLVALAEAPADRRPALDDFVRTALARALAGGEIDPTPLDVAEIPRDFDPDARARARAALVRRLDETGVTAGREYLDALVDSWLGQLHDLLGGAEWPPDPRFVTGILLRTAQS